VRLVFEDEDLRRLYVEPDFRIARIGPELTKHFRRKVALLAAATDQRDLYNLRSLHFEKLAGDRATERSIRLNDQWRLILRLEQDDEGHLIVIIKIEDYH
jgi:proteic killer suppression protein